MRQCFGALGFMGPSRGPRCMKKKKESNSGHSWLRRKKVERQKNPCLRAPPKFNPPLITASRLLCSYVVCVYVVRTWYKLSVLKCLQIVYGWCNIHLNIKWLKFITIGLIKLFTRIVYAQMRSSDAPRIVYEVHDDDDSIATRHPVTCW